MAEISPSPPSLKKAKRAKKEDPLQAADSRRLDSLRWNDSLPNDDPFFLLAGSNEGGPPSPLPLPTTLSLSLSFNSSLFFFFLCIFFSF